MPRRLLLALALALPACSEPTPCKLDSECGNLAMCVHPVLNGKEQPDGRCAAICKSSVDCVIAGHPTDTCGTIAAGQGSNQVKGLAGTRIDAVATPLDGLKACLRGNELAR
jgi:hypothetical protein